MYFGITIYRIQTDRGTLIVEIDDQDADSIEAKLKQSGLEVKDAATGSGLVHLKDCKNLTWLELSATKVSNAGLAHLQNHAKLTNLNLEQTKISDAGLAHLERLNQLEILRLTRSEVTEEGVRNLAAALPRCKIAWDGGVIEPTVASTAGE